MAESLELVADAARPDVQIQVLQKLAEHCADLGDLAGATAMLREVAERLGKADGPTNAALRERVAARLDALASGSIDVEDAVLRLEAVRARAAADSAAVLEAKERLASRLLFAGKFDAALPIQREVVTLRARVGDTRDRWIARGALAVLLSGTGEHAAARTEFAEVLRAVARLVPEHHPGLVLARRYAAWNLAAMDPEAGADLADVLEDLLAGALAGLEHERSCAQPRRLHLVAAAAAHDVGTALASLDKVPATRRPAVLEATFVLQETARALASDVFALRRRLVSTPGPTAEAALQQMGSIAKELAKLQEDGGGFGNVMRVLDVERQQGRLAELMQQVPGATQLCAPIDVASVQAQLEPGAAAVSFVRWRRAPLPATPGSALDEHYAAMLVRRDAELSYLELGDAVAIDEAIAAWRGAAGDSAAFRAQSLRLHQLLLQSVRAQLGPVQRLFVVPDDALHLVNFDVLAATADGPDLECVRCVSLRQIHDRDEAEPTAPRLLAFGGIDYGAAALATGPVASTPASPLRGLPTAALLDQPGAFAPLPHTATEIAQVAAEFGGRFGDRASIELRRGGEATKQALLEQASACDFLHLATHGYVGEGVDLGTQPADLRRALGSGNALAGVSPASLCGLAFADANVAAACQTRLTAAELAWLDLSRCRLAVLSSCDSTLGVRLAGRGIASLQTALHRAGVRTSIAALWAVDDRATAEFMGRFYRHLWQHGRSPESALRRARAELQAQLRPDGAPRWAPRDCAAWVVVGG